MQCSRRYGPTLASFAQTHSHISYVHIISHFYTASTARCAGDYDAGAAAAAALPCQTTHMSRKHIRTTHDGTTPDTSRDSGARAHDRAARFKIRSLCRTHVTLGQTVQALGYHIQTTLHRFHHSSRQSAASKRACHCHCVWTVQFLFRKLLVAFVFGKQTVAHVKINSIKEV